MQWDGAPSTATSPSLGWNSNPTPKPLPVVGEGESYDLLRRQVSATSTVCGYINGLKSGDSPMLPPQFEL